MWDHEEGYFIPVGPLPYLRILVSGKDMEMVARTNVR